MWYKCTHAPILPIFITKSQPDAQPGPAKPCKDLQSPLHPRSDTELLSALYTIIIIIITTGLHRRAIIIIIIVGLHRRSTIIIIIIIGLHRRANKGIYSSDGGADMMAMRRRSNSGCLSCLVKMSARLWAEGMSISANTPAATHVRMK